MTGLSEARGLAVMGCLPCTACGDFSEVCEWLGAVSRSGGPWGGAPARLVVRRPTGFGRGCQRAFERANGLWAGLPTILRAWRPTRFRAWRPTAHGLCGAPWRAPQRRFVWDATTAAVRSPPPASAPLSLRSPPAGRAAGGVERGRGQPGRH